MTFFVYSSKKPKTKSHNPSDDVAVPDDTFLTSLQQQFSNLSTHLASNDEGVDDDDMIGGFDDERDNVMPQAANEMGSGGLQFWFWFCFLLFFFNCMFFHFFFFY